MGDKENALMGDKENQETRKICNRRQEKSGWKTKNIGRRSLLFLKILFKILFILFN